MRLPLTKVYRAFEELDDFSDEECERFVFQARVQAGASAGCLPVIAGGAAGVVWMVVGVAVVQGLVALGGAAAGTGPMAVLLWAGGLVMTMGLAGLICRDVLLIRAVRARVHSARCTNCRFSLLGLPVRHGAVRCPECGTDLTLLSLGLKEEDLIPRRAGGDT